MLKSYEAVYENGQLTWVAEQPSAQTARVIVTVVEEVEASPPSKRRRFPGSLAGQVKILGDVVGPIVDEADWECLK
ncbi:MAG: hypothetical protein AAFR58_16200 [Cyanobacteria bacterium J06627_28]